MKRFFVLAGCAFAVIIQANNGNIDPALLAELAQYTAEHAQKMQILRNREFFLIQQCQVPNLSAETRANLQKAFCENKMQMCNCQGEVYGFYACKKILYGLPLDYPEPQL